MSVSDAKDHPKHSNIFLNIIVFHIKDDDNVFEIS